MDTVVWYPASAFSTQRDAGCQTSGHCYKRDIRVTKLKAAKSTLGYATWLETMLKMVGLQYNRYTQRNVFHIENA